MNNKDDCKTRKSSGRFSECVDGLVHRIICKTRKSNGRFSEHVDGLAHRIISLYGLSLGKSRKLIGQSLTDERVIAVILEHVNRVIVGRGDGMTLIDVGEQEEWERLKRRNQKTVQNKEPSTVVKKPRRKSA